jgi:hypothetical protein
MLVRGLGICFYGCCNSEEGKFSDLIDSVYSLRGAFVKSAYICYGLKESLNLGETFST